MQRTALMKLLRETGEKAIHTALHDGCTYSLKVYTKKPRDHLSWLLHFPLTKEALDRTNFLYTRFLLFIAAITKTSPKIKDSPPHIGKSL